MNGGSDKEPKITISGVTKSYGDKHVLKGIDLEVYPGETMAIIGPSACGKTVLLKCIIGLVRPDSGKLLIDGEDTAGYSSRQRDRVMANTGMLFQQSALFDSMTVWENISFRLSQTNNIERNEVRRITGSPDYYREAEQRRHYCRHSRPLPQRIVRWHEEAGGSCAGNSRRPENPAA